MSRTKLLIVYRWLNQSGSQRWIYEICKHIDREKFEVGVLCDEKYRNCGLQSTFDNYYYLKLKELNVNLYEDLREKGALTIWERAFNKIERNVFKFLSKKHVSADRKIANLIYSHDVVCLIDFFGYNEVKRELSKTGYQNFFIVLHSHKFQFSYDPYKRFNSNNFNFTYFCPKQIAEMAESGVNVEKNRYSYNPLVLNLTDYPNLFNPLSADSVVIGIFTRISAMKPIDAFIEAFAKLQQQHSMRRLTLNVYGQIEDQPYYEQLQDLIKTLGINSESIRFVGHTQDIAASIKNDRVNIYWGLSINTSVGYASIEVGAMGVPCVFWNTDHQSSPTFVQENTNGLMLAHNNLDDFINSNLKLLSGGETLAEMSVKQSQYFLDNHNIIDRIKNFEDYVVSIKNQTVQTS